MQRTKVTIDKKQRDFDAVLSLQDFVDAYTRAHLQKYGSDFIIN
jgi:hypothetical protein